MTQIVVTNKWKSNFSYDGLGRRRVRQEYNWVSGNWSLASETRYVYDGMLVIQERDGSNARKVTYTRGLDLSETLQGAGGVGGLIARTENTSYVMPSSYYVCDASGNVTMMVNIQGNIVARYVYDPFGRTIGMSGWLADANPYRFSSKEQDGKSGLYYYGYRFYEPNLQRWLNQDPIGERGGINLYQFVSNDPVNRIDPLGESDFNRSPVSITRPGPGMPTVPTYGPPAPEPARRAPGEGPSIFNDLQRSLFGLPPQMPQLPLLQNAKIGMLPFGPGRMLIDPRRLRMPPTRCEVDLSKLANQMRQYGSSLEGMPAIEVTEGAGGELMINNGVTRATRAAITNPGTPVPVYPSWEERLCGEAWG